MRLLPVAMSPYAVFATLLAPRLPLREQVFRLRFQLVHHCVDVSHSEGTYSATFTQVV